MRKAGQGEGEAAYCWRKCEMQQPQWKNAGKCVPKVNSELAFQPGEVDIYVHTETCTDILRTVLFATAPSRMAFKGLKKNKIKANPLHAFRILWDAIYMGANDPNTGLRRNSTMC